LLVFTSPEIALSKRFNEEVLRYPSLQHRVCLLAIDEVHLTSEWRSFRPSYSELKTLRSRLPIGIPMLGVSATLDPVSQGLVKEYCGFRSSTRLIRTSIDRPWIYMQVECMRESEKSMLDLQHLLPRQIGSIYDIPKTIIYIDSVAQICKACGLFRRWAMQLGYQVSPQKVVAPIFADMADDDKSRTSTRFSRPSSECDGPRILIATDSYGLGVDNPDVEVVVQWLLPSSISKLHQRMGRAVRSVGKQGRLLFLYPKWCSGPRSKAPVRSSQAEKVLGRTRRQGAPLTSVEAENSEGSESCSQLKIPSKDTERKTAPDRRRDMPSGLYELINPGISNCIREQTLRVFADTTYTAGGPEKPVYCCSNCDPDFASSTRAYPDLKAAASKDSLPQPWFRKELLAWRKRTAAEVCRRCEFGFFPSIVMPDTVLDQIAMWGSQIDTREDILCLVGPWSEVADYSAEVISILRKGRDISADGDTEVQYFALRLAVRETGLPPPPIPHQNPRLAPRTVYQYA